MEHGYDGDRDLPIGKAAKSRKRRTVLPFTPDEPAKIMEGHVQDLAPGRRGGWRQTDSDRLGTYADSGQINEDQLEAARWYQETYRAREPHCETKFERVSRGSNGLPISLIQGEAMKRIIAVDTRLSEENRLIVRAICGEGHHASHVVRMVTGEQGKHYPIPRFREALNALRNAILAAKKDGWKAMMERVS
jgi:hypothetical protein